MTIGNPVRTQVFTSRISSLRCILTPYASITALHMYITSTNKKKLIHKILKYIPDTYIWAYKNNARRISLAGLYYSIVTAMVTAGTDCRHFYSTKSSASNEIGTS